MARRTTTTARSEFPVLGPKRAKYIRDTRFDGVGRIPSEIVRTHLHTLHGLGLPYAAIARDAKVHVSVVRRIAAGTFDTTCRRQAAAILAVTHHPNQRQEMVIARGALRRVHALSRIGWSFRAIAEHAQVSADDIKEMRNHRTIAWETWSAIHDTYEALSATPAPPGRADQVRRAAHRKGWPAPLDWEGHDIDDPRVTVVAQPWAPKTSKEIARERRERVAELTERGLSAAEIADRVGVTKRTVVRDRLEVGVAAA